MLRYTIISVFVGISFIHADNLHTLDKLEIEKQALLLKLETYSLKKQIIEMKNFIANDKLEKEKKFEREKALIQLRNDLRANRRHLAYAR
jgi:hypothetical protein